MAQLKRSPFYAQWRGHIKKLFHMPQLHYCAQSRPRLQAFIRIAQWNIEKGKNFKAIMDRITADEVLRWADIFILNEADWGMIRSQNRHVAKALAEELGMHMAFAPAHLELTKGTGEELEIDGENRESLQGNAILSRYPIVEARVVPLPKTFEAFDFHEKRFGQRNCLWARIQLNHDSLWIGSVHLELRNTPRCRARQMAHIMAHLPDGGLGAYILGGDLNTNTFERATHWRTAKSFLRLWFSSPSELKTSLLNPDQGREPLFKILKSYGFAWEGFNAYEETARVPIDSLEESSALPRFLQNSIKRKLEPYDGFLCFKLDWIVGKNIRPLAEGEMMDASTQVVSRRAASIKGDNSSPDRASDHLPICADIALK